MPESVPFEIPAFTFSRVFFTAVGATVLWMKWGWTQRRAFALSVLIAPFCKKDSRVFSVLEFLVFIALGCVVGIVLTEPGNARQAIAAGMGWTGLLVTEKTREGENDETDL